LVVETQQIEKGTLKIATPINCFSDCNNVLRKGDKESGVTLTKIRDKDLLKSVVFLTGAALLRYGASKIHHLYSIPEVIPQQEPSPRKVNKLPMEVITV
jgi:hypothetical protein